MLPEIGRDLSGRLELDELTDIVVRRSVETLGALSGQVVIINPAGAIHKEYRMPAGVLPGFVPQLPPLDNLLDQLRQNPHGLIINDTHNDPNWPVDEGMPTSSAIVVPLWGRLDVIGLLVLFHERQGYFSPEHQLLLQAIASQAAIALQSVQMYASTSQDRQRMAAILESAADAILTFNREGDLQSVNPAGEQLFADDGLQPGCPVSAQLQNAGFGRIARSSARLGLSKDGRNRHARRTCLHSLDHANPGRWLCGDPA